MTENHPVEHHLAQLLADDDERRALERELHDGVQQRLVAVAVGLQLARRLVGDDQGAAREALDELRAEVGRAVDELRAVAERIHPPLLDTQGLAAALRMAAARHPQARLHLAVDEPPVPAAALTAYRVCVAALHDAGDGAVEIRARSADGVLELEVAPGPADARGFASAAGRAAVLGGRLDVARERVRLTLPLRS